MPSCVPVSALQVNLSLRLRWRMGGDSRILYFGFCLWCIFRSLTAVFKYTQLWLFFESQGGVRRYPTIMVLRVDLGFGRRWHDVSTFALDLAMMLKQSSYDAHV